ncbi:MAG: hypothetical protein ACI9FR_003270 [Cryomorphaceae bacterium]|jgi:uncharacterized protein YgfB (UPF0149 family)
MNTETSHQSRADRFTQIEATLALSDIELSVSEVHGTVVGAISNHMKSGVTPDLLKLIEPAANPDDPRFSQLRELLYDMYRENSEVLLESKEGFAPLLPNDDESLSMRVDGLATWCKGFLLGLLYNNAFSIDQIPEGGAEIARDMLEIAEAGVGSDEEREEDWALSELEEYIKVGAQLIFEFIYSERSAAAPKPSQ